MGFRDLRAAFIRGTPVWVSNINNPRAGARGVVRAIHTADFCERVVYDVLLSDGGLHRFEESDLDVVKEKPAPEIQTEPTLRLSDTLGDIMANEIIRMQQAMNDALPYDSLKAVREFTVNWASSLRPKK